jgi:unsaturated rhamnogalacturonyl hydrolase
VLKYTDPASPYSPARAEPLFNQQWTFAALYDGLLAASKTTGDARYHDAVVKMAQRFDWKLLDARFPDADDMAPGQAYLDLCPERRGAGGHSSVEYGKLKH